MNYNLLYRLFKGNGGSLCLLLLLGAIDVVLGLLIVGGSKRLIDIATGARQGVLWLVILWLALFFILSITFRNLFSIYTVRMQTEVRNRLNTYFFSHILRAKWRSMQSFHSGDIMARMDTDIGDVTRLYTDTVPQFVLTFFKLCGAFCFLYLMEPHLALILAGLVPVVLFSSKFYFKKMRRLSQEIKSLWSHIWQFIQESVQNGEIIKGLRLENLFFGKLDEKQQIYAAKIKSRNSFSFYSNMVLSLGFAAGYLLTFSWGIFRLQAGLITFGMMTAFLQLVNMIQGPALSLVSMAPSFVSSYTALERLNDLEQILTEQEQSEHLLSGLESICFSDISFSYLPGVPVLEHLSMRFEKGKMYALTGKTGCGKTTIIRLMLAFIRSQEGEISLFDGREWHLMDERLRINFSYVPQGCHLFSGTIRENLKLAKPDAGEDELCIVLHRAAAGFVFDLPDGLDTSLNEQGGGLSGGQIQRLAIARALLCPGAILLLDEITSSLDEGTEYEIIESLKKNVHDKIIVIVSHKQQVISACDQVYLF